MSVIRIRMPASGKVLCLPAEPTSFAKLFSGTLFAVCVVVAFYGYFLKPPLKKRAAPHILLATAAGPVLFPHLHHSHKDGGAFDCSECHHKIGEDTATVDLMRCRSCHYDDPDVVETVCADNTQHPRCIGRRCNACHEGEECSFCHRRQP